MGGHDLKLFKAVGIEDRSLLAPILLESGRMSCDYSFANLYMWGEINDLRWRLREGLLLVHSGRDDVLLMPVGRPVDPGELLRISDEMRHAGHSGDFALVDAAWAAVAPGLDEHFTAGEDPDNADYIYSSRALVELKGNRLHRKKNLLSQFLRNNPGYRSGPMAAGDAGECFALAEKWCEDRTCEELGFTHETSAMKRGFDRFEALGLEGLVVRTGGTLAAFSVFDRLNRTTADVHFEKYDSGVKGSAQAVNWETARRLAPDFEFVNREQDMGLEGLRKAKQSYCPAFTVRTCRLKRR